MSFNDIKTKLRVERGFTIVELLIVIVVIGILAAITLVSYNGVVSRANTASAVSAISAATAKAEAYNADPDNTGYPTSLAALTTGTAGKSFQLTGVTLADDNSTTVMTAAPDTPSTVNFYVCGTNTGAAATTLATVLVPTGNEIKAWDYSTGALSTTIGNAGQTSGNAANTFNITCYLTLT